MLLSRQSAIGRKLFKRTVGRNDVGAVRLLNKFLGARDEVIICHGAQHGETIAFTGNKKIRKESAFSAEAQKSFTSSAYPVNSLNIVQTFNRDRVDFLGYMPDRCGESCRIVLVEMQG